MKAMGGCARRKGKVLYVLPLSRAVSPTFDFMMRTSRRATTPHLSVTVVALAALAWVVLLLSSTAEPRQAQLVSERRAGRVRSSPQGWRRSAAPALGAGAMRRFWFLIGAAAGSWGMRTGGVDLVRVDPGPRGALPVAGRHRLPRAAGAGRRGAAVAAPGRTDTGRARADDPGRSHGRRFAARCAAGSWSSSPCSAPAATDGSSSRSISLAYPVGDIVLITIVIYTCAAGRAPRRSRRFAAPGRHRPGGLRRRRLRLQLPDRRGRLQLGQRASTSAGSSASP